MTTKHTISFKLNGEMRTFDFEPWLTLSDALRTRVGTKSIKCGCERGDCGTCTIIMNGRSVKSCLILAVEADGCDIQTTEGLAQNGQLSPVQQSMLAHNSFQCGFCAPGITMAASELLAKTSDPTEEQVKEQIAGNLCRCTGYTPIIEGILDTKNFINKEQK